MIQNLIFVILFFENIISCFRTSTLVHTFQSTSSEFFLFQILWQKISKQIKTSEKGHSFYNTVSLKRRHVTNLNSFEIETNMLPKHRQKTLSFYEFSSKHVSVWRQKKHLHCPISWSPRTTFLKHFESKYVYISVYLPQKIFVSKT